MIRSCIFTPRFPDVAVIAGGGVINSPALRGLL
jgi:hypothetical protein